MQANDSATAETPEQAAAAISAALDFLRAEADVAGLHQVARQISHASRLAKKRAAGAPRPAETAGERPEPDPPDAPFL